MATDNPHHVGLTKRTAPERQLLTSTAGLEMGRLKRGAHGWTDLRGLVGCRDTCTSQTVTAPIYLAMYGIVNEITGWTCSCFCWGPAASKTPATDNRALTSLSPIKLLLVVVEGWLLAVRLQPTTVSMCCFSFLLTGVGCQQHASNQQPTTVS
jgi:hypothetical protein